jgi:hypothetical protein
MLPLLDDRDAWDTLDINDRPPFVERLWRPWNGHRLFLHGPLFSHLPTAQWGCRENGG